MKITKRVVDSSKPKQSRYYVWDSSLPGFGLVVQPTGTKSYCYQYRTSEGRTRRMTIGKHGPYTTEQARSKAKNYQRAVDEGRDPLGEKQTRRNALTVGQLLDIYLDSAKFAEKTEITQSVDKGRVERHLKPLLGKKIADTLTSEDVRKAFNAIKTGKTAKEVKTGPRGLARVRGGEGAARMAIRLLRSCYSWAVGEEIATINPAKGVALGHDGRRNAVLTPDDYKAMFKAIDDLEQKCLIRTTTADAIRVIALTGARRGEIAGLKWRHVNLKKGILELPDHKASKRTGEPRTIGLPAAAQAIISRQSGGESDEYVFSPARGEGPISLSKPWRSIRKAAELAPEIGLHGLRHSLATNMAVGGAQAAEIMTVLGHANIATSQKYVHVAQDIHAEMAEKAASGISAALEGKKPANIVKIKDRKNA